MPSYKYYQLSNWEWVLAVSVTLGATVGLPYSGRVDMAASLGWQWWYTPLCLWG